jgi:hypothetical protein
MPDPSPTTRRLSTTSLLAGGAALGLGLLTAVFGASSVDPTSTGGAAIWVAIAAAGLFAAYTGVSRSADALGSAIHDKDRDT